MRLPGSQPQNNGVIQTQYSCPQSVVFPPDSLKRSVWSLRPSISGCRLPGLYNSVRPLGVYAHRSSTRIFSRVLSPTWSDDLNSVRTHQHSMPSEVRRQSKSIGKQPLIGETDEER